MSTPLQRNMDAMAEIQTLKQKNAELAAVLGLLRLHRTGPDWEQPIPSDLLDREDAALKRHEEGK